MTIRSKDTPAAMNFKHLYNKKYEDFAQAKQAGGTPARLLDMAVRYFTWAEENALQAGESASYQGVITQHDVSRPRVFTINGLLLFCGLSNKGYERYRKDKAYSEVVEFIDTVIKEQKYQLAANNMVNSSLIIKDLDLDKPTQINVNNAPGSAINEEQMVDAVKKVLGEI